MTSTIIVAKAGSGKTIKLESLRKLPFVKYSVDITGKPLIDFLHDVDEGKKKFLVVPDYISVLGHSNKTKEMFRGYLRAMMDEGVSDIDVYGMITKFKNTPKAGLITAITPEYYESNVHLWRIDGFLQRLLPFSYSHSAETTRTIMDNIKSRNNVISHFKINVTRKISLRPQWDDNIDSKMRLLAYTIKEKEAMPYRAYQQIIALCSASAVIRKSNTIEKIDIELIENLSKYFNKSQIPI